MYFSASSFSFSRLCFLLWLSGLFQGCGPGSTGNPLDLFTGETTLRHETLPSGEYVLPMTGQILNWGNFLIVMSEHKGYALGIYDKTQLCYLPPVAPMGPGPEEFSRIINIQPGDSSHIYAHDINRNEMVEYLIRRCGRDSVHTEKKRVYSWKSLSLRTLKVAGYFVRLCLAEKEMFALADAGGKELGLFEQYPPLGDAWTEQSASLRSTSYQGQLSVRPGDSLVAYAPVSAPIVQVFSVGEKKIVKKSELVLGYAHPKIVKNQQGELMSAHGKDNPVMYISITGSREYIYVLYSGRTFNEYRTNAFYGRDILVFDWNCQPVKHYVLDVDVNCIDVSPDDKMIWATAVNPDPELVKFRMKE